MQQELRANRYDIVGISSIIVNVGKVREMCRMVRELSPQSTIVIGGHVAAIPGIEKMIDADHIVRGDGIAWMRRFLGEDETAPIRHPEIISGFGARTLGVTLPITKGTTAATIIPSRGLSRWDATSAPRPPSSAARASYLNFYDSGKELYDVMCEMEGKLEVKSFFMMDENFLLHKRRAMELLDLMKAGHKAWSLYVFSSANAISQYTMRELVELGVSWIWMGLESPRSVVHQAEGRGHDRTHRGTAQARHQTAGLDDRRAGTPHAGEHRSARSSTPSRTIPISTSSCCTRRCPARRSSSR